MNEIINILKTKKSIPLDKFINIALYDKEVGYYIKNNPFGKEGDFITFPAFILHRAPKILNVERKTIISFNIDFI